MRKLLALISLLILTGVVGPSAVAQEATPGSACIATTEDENVAIVQRWYDELFNQHNLDVIDELIAPDAPHHQSFPEELTSREATRTTFAAIFAAMPDMHVTVNDILSEDDLVVARYTATATFQSDLLGVPATGEIETFSGINIFEITCGTISESWAEVDRIAQFGLATAAPSTPVDTPASSASPAASCAPGSEDANADLVQRWIDAWNAHDVAALDELATEATVHHWGHSSGDTVGANALQDRTQAFFDAFPDITITLEEVVTDGDLVAFRFTATGTHAGQFFDIAPTNVHATWTGINVVRIECGVIAESWSETDGYGLRQQLLAPTSATPES